MLYLTQAGAAGGPLRSLIADHPEEFGLIVTANEGRRSVVRETAVMWAADNGAFSTRYRGDDWYLQWLGRFTADERSRCLFAPAPDVVANFAATEERSRPMLPRIREAGFSAALVAQDGMEWTTWDPWDEIDALFIGGSDAWKLGEEAANIAAVASSLGKWVHMGRVNSSKRLRYAEWIGCDSADGTFAIRDPSQNSRRMLRWREQGTLL
jgi:hypothetical protein